MPTMIEAKVCILNDIIIGAHHLIDFHGLERILVTDLDVHQGNGTAVLAQGDPASIPFHARRQKLSIPQGNLRPRHSFRRFYWRRDLPQHFRRIIGAALQYRTT